MFPVMTGMHELQESVHAMLPCTRGGDRSWKVHVSDGHVVGGVHLRGVAAEDGEGGRLLHTQTHHHARVPVQQLVTTDTSGWLYLPGWRAGWQGAPCACHPVRRCTGSADLFCEL